MCELQLLRILQKKKLNAYFANLQDIKTFFSSKKPAKTKKVINNVEKSGKLW
jgi:hypothetical protein